MKFTELLHIVGNRPVFPSSLLRAGDVDTTDLASQISRWAASGKLLQLRRGVYALAEQYRSRRPELYEVANVLVRPSYVSLESALARHGVIPEAVFTVASVTTGRPCTFDTPVGRYAYRHIVPSLFWGFEVESLNGAEMLIAEPEKALLDLVHLRTGGDRRPFLEQMRLDLSSLDQDVLEQMAQRSGSPKLLRAAENVARLRESEGEWETL